MSLTYATSFNGDDLEEFLLEEHAKDTGIPLHPFRSLNKQHTLGITDGKGCLFVYDGHVTAYGADNDHSNLLRTLTALGQHVEPRKLITVRPMLAKEYTVAALETCIQRGVGCLYAVEVDHVVYADQLTRHTAEALFRILLCEYCISIQ